MPADGAKELQLFESVNARLASNAQQSAPTQHLSDVIFNAGGSVWSLDWSTTPPEADGQEASTQYLAVRSCWTNHFHAASNLIAVSGLVGV